MTEEEKYYEIEYISPFSPFAVFFYGDHIFIEGKEYPIGQSVVDILNLDDELLVEINRRMLDFILSLLEALDEDAEEMIQPVQEKLAYAWELVSALPVYRDLKIDWGIAHHVIQDIFSNRDLWLQIRSENSEERREFDERFRRVISVGQILQGFRRQVELMVEGYFEPLPSRNADAYAEGYFRFYQDMATLDEENDDEQGISLSYSVEVNFVPMLSPSEAGKLILAEQARFHELLDFLEVEFYRALAQGNVPRRCHNCGKYFLLTSGYDIRYCNNIAPGETERTCRKVGAHRKEAQGRANRTPAQKEYARTYTRLKQRKVRKKISTDEWNAAMAKAQALLEQSERGELTDEELKQKLNEL